MSSETARERQGGTRSTVVIVEDDASVRLHASEVLQEAGYAVAEFSTADTALSYIWHNANRVGAIFADVQTPGFLSGMELAEIVSRRWDWIEILITTGTTLRPDFAPAQLHFLQKPWSAGDVLQAISAALDRSSTGEKGARAQGPQSPHAALA